MLIKYRGIDKDLLKNREEAENLVTEVIFKQEIKNYMLIIFKNIERGIRRSSRKIERTNS